MVVTWFPHGPVAAQADDTASEGAERVSVVQVSEFFEPPPRHTDDPWADPVLRWPDPLAESQLGTEPTYYWFARDDRRSLLPTATLQRPLQVWAGGDFMSGGPVYGFRQLFADDPRFGFTEAIITSSGVVTEWFFDWTGHMADEVAESPYDVIVLAMGANDKQKFRGLEAAFGEDEWAQRYRTRVRELVAAATRPGRLVIWVGLPPLQPSHFAPLPAVVNPLAAAAVAEVEGAIYVDLFDTMAVDGAFAHQLGPEHDNRLIRTSDGIHYTYYGGLLLTEPILAEIKRHSG